MAYSAITSTEVQVGKPVTSSLFTKVKDNFDDHESRILAVEAVTSQVVIFNFPILTAVTASTLTGVTYWRCPFDVTLTDCKVVAYEIGSLTGDLELDVKKNTSPDSTGMTSVFTTQPSLDYGTASDYDESSNAVFDASEQDVSAGEWLRLDITSLPSGGVVGKFNVYLVGEI